MRQIPKPTDNSGDVFIDCIDIVRNASLKARLTAIKNHIENATTEFENKITKGTIHTIIREAIINGNVTAKEIEAVYTLRMVKKGTPGRKYYDKILLSAPLGICPLCSQREVTTLDHYLPKTEYPRLSVAPVNLIPCCSDCNKTKLVGYPTQDYEETLHPYFDNVEDDIWLNAKVIQRTPPVISFNVIPPNNWSPLLKNRVEFHFKSFSLGKLYSTQAAVTLTQINKRLEVLFQQFGSGGVKKYLEEEADSRSQTNRNSWQTAMYNAMAKDNWFCNGGFRLT